MSASAEKIDRVRPATQNWEAYTDIEHGMWKTLYQRQTKLLQGRICDEFLDGLKALQMPEDKIPDYRILSERMHQLTGWQIQQVPGYIPVDQFFGHLANRRFPTTSFIRRPEEIDYLEEPDLFHDVFGHIPMLANPIFADYMHAFGEGGLKAIKLDSLKFIDRLYWFTVEFGLIKSKDGLRIYGSGIASSKGETLYCLDDPAPNRIAFNLERIMRTTFAIDDYQRSYFVIDNFEQLFDATRPDFAPIYDKLKSLSEYQPEQTYPGDVVIHQGSGKFGSGVAKPA